MLEFVKEFDKESGALRFIVRGVGKKRYSGPAGRGYARWGIQRARQAQQVGDTAKKNLNFENFRFLRFRGPNA